MVTLPPRKESMTKPPKYVKKANQWVVTEHIRLEKGGDKFEQHWFNTKLEADKFYEETK